MVVVVGVRVVNGGRRGVGVVRAGWGEDWLR